MNNSFITKLGMGAALVSMTIGTAYAQVSPANRADTSDQTGPAPQSGFAPSSSGNLDDLVIVEGEPEAVFARRTPPPSPMAMNQSARVSYVSRRDWRAKGWKDADFDRRRVQSANLCGRITYFTTGFAELADAYRSKIPAVEDLAVRYDKMRRKIKRAGAIRTVANILAPLIAIPTGGLGYAAIVGASAIGGEAQGRAGTKAQLVGNDAGKLNNELTGLHIAFNLYSLELYADYLGMMSNYCANPAVIASFNYTTASIQTDTSVTQQGFPAPGQPTRRVTYRDTLPREEHRAGQATRLVPYNFGQQQ